MLVEYFEDAYENNPQKMMTLDAESPHGDIVLQTGDPEIDEIERRLAAGEDPDEVLAGWGDNLGGRAEAAEEVADTPEEIEDDYLGGEDDEPKPGLKWSP